MSYHNKHEYKFYILDNFWHELCQTTSAIIQGGVEIYVYIYVS